MADTIQPSATSKTALAPDLRRMDDRSARAWTERMAVRPLEPATYVVDSESDATYVVDFEDNSCTCPDHQIRGQICKHMRRVAIEISTRRVPPPGKRRATCAACGVETFVAVAVEDEDEPADDAGEVPSLCGNCELEPGDVVRDRETGDRLVVARVTADSADEVEIPAAGCTVADYETNADYPDDDLVVEASYLASVARSNDPKRYSFPLSRLELVDDAAILD